MSVRRGTQDGRGTRIGRKAKALIAVGTVALMAYVISVSPSSADPASLSGCSYDPATQEQTCIIPQDPATTVTVTQDPVTVTASGSTVTTTVPGPTSTVSTTVRTTVTKTTARGTVTVTASLSSTTAPTTSTQPVTTSTTTPVPTTTVSSTPTTTTSTTAVAGLNCAPHPSACGFPDATNTGAKGTLTLVKAGDSGPGWHATSGGTVIIDGNGAVFADKLTTGDVNIQGNDVTVRDVMNTASGDSIGGFAIRHGQRATITDVTIGPAASSPRLLVGIKDVYGDAAGTVIERADISGAETGVQMDSGTLADSYIHDLRMQSGDHVNGQTSNGGGSLLTIRHNTVFNPISQTDAVSLFEDFGAQSNKVIDGNLLAGGGYSIYGGANPGGQPTSNIKITNNRISRIYYPNGGFYGPLAAFDSNGSGNVFTGNIWDDSGAPLN